MELQIIRIKDGIVVDTAKDKDEANRKLFFYDSEENPHRIKVKT